MNINTFLTGIVGFFLSIIFYSCAPTQTEIWINEDDSGRMEITMDMGSMVDHVGEIFKMIDTSGVQDTAQVGNSLIEKEGTMDSTLSLYQIMPDSVRSLSKDPEILKKILLNMKVNEEEKTALVKIIMDYKNKNELNRMMGELSKKATSDPMSSPQMENDVEKMFLLYQLNKESAVITIPQIDIRQEIKDDPTFSDLLPKLDSIKYLPDDSDFFQVVNMFFGGTTTIIIHAPNDIVFTSENTAEISGSKATFTYNNIELLKSDRRKRDIIIKYKN